MRPEARFHDGSKLTAHDAAFSLNMLKEKGHPLIIVQLRDMVKAEALDDATLVVTFAEKRARDVPLYVAGLPIFSQGLLCDAGRSTNRRSICRWARGRTRSANSRSTATSNTNGSRIGGPPTCRSAVAATISTSCATSSIATATSRSKALPARTICSARNSPRASGRRATISRRSRTAASSARPCRTRSPSGGQGWFINTRRDKFKDPRVREALIYAFDFEWTNKTIMYGAYARTRSPFQNSDMVAEGPPSPEELKLLEPFRGQVPGRGVRRSPSCRRCPMDRDRTARCCARRRNCCRRPGSEVKDGKRLLPNGEVFTIEFLLDEPSFQPHHATFIKNLGQLGIEASIRLIDAVQYRARVEDFDFDMTIERLSMSATPGDSMRPYFSSQAAATKGSYNLAGVANPAIDALVEKIIGAETRADLTIACRALDRVFRAGRYWVPQWYRTTHPIAYWDQFSHPEKPPRYAQGVGAPENWWYDAAKAAKLEQAK